MELVLPESLEWRGDHLSLRPASPHDVGGIVALHRAAPEVTMPDEPASPEAWFWSGGPWMHELYCMRHIEVYNTLGWDC